MHFAGILQHLYETDFQQFWGQFRNSLFLSEKQVSALDPSLFCHLRFFTANLLNALTQVGPRVHTKLTSAFPGDLILCIFVVVHSLRH